MKPHEHLLLGLKDMDPKECGYDGLWNDYWADYVPS